MAHVVLKKEGNFEEQNVKKCARANKLFKKNIVQEISQAPEKYIQIQNLTGCRQLSKQIHEEENVFINLNTESEEEACLSKSNC